MSNGSSAGCPERKRPSSSGESPGRSATGPASNPRPASAEGPRIAGTRVPVWVLEQGRRLGTSEAELLRAYPDLRAEDLVNAWAYARSHPGEIDAQIRENEEVLALAS